MGLEYALLAMMNRMVMIAPRTGFDVYGKPTYGTAVTSVARVEYEPRLVKVARGLVNIDEVVSRAMVFLPPTAIIALTSQLTLPDGSRPEILRVDAVDDEYGLHHYEVYV